MFVGNKENRNNHRGILNIFRDADIGASANYTVMMRMCTAMIAGGIPALTAERAVLRMDISVSLPMFSDTEFMDEVVEVMSNVVVRLYRRLQMDMLQPDEALISMAGTISIKLD